MHQEHQGLDEGSKKPQAFLALYEADQAHHYQLCCECGLCLSPQCLIPDHQVALKDDGAKSSKVPPLLTVLHQWRVLLKAGEQPHEELL